jgi:hypothetical protein
MVEHLINCTAVDPIIIEFFFLTYNLCSSWNYNMNKFVIR